MLSQIISVILFFAFIYLCFLSAIMLFQFIVMIGSLIVGGVVLSIAMVIEGVQKLINYIIGKKK